MSFIPPKFSLSNLDISVNKIDKQLFDKKNKELLLKANNKTLARHKLIYDSDWVVNEIEDINGAVSTTYEELLPQKVPYDFSFDLQIPEGLLPFLRYDVIAKTTPTQDVRGVGVFNFSSLREVSLQLYDWAGITEILAPANLSPWGGGDTGFGWWESEYEPKSSVPPVALPNPEIAIPHLPKPESAYETVSEFISVYITSVGSFWIGPYALNANGSQVYVGGEWMSLSSWIDSAFVTYHPGSHIMSFLVYARSRTTFEPPIYDFPIPISSNATYSFPQGTTTDESNCDEYFFSQYYVADEIVDFNTYVILVGYDEASEVFTDYYPNVIITAEEDGPPYKAFENITVQTIKTCNQQIIIDKVADDNFRFRIKGYLLLVSPAVTETSYSDPTLPTYQPQGEDLFVRLKVYYNSQSIQKKNAQYEFK